MLPEEIKNLNEKIRSCRRCPLGDTRMNAVPGEGCISAGVMFIGEAPGASEDQRGIPFCGKAGRVLDELLLLAGLNRDDVFIGNILKCRPPKNRNPRPCEIETCTPYLDYQINFIKPGIICCLGNFATAYIMKKFGLGTKIQGISKIHGMIFIADAPYGKIRIMPLLHPAVVTYNVNKKPVLAKDFRQLKNIPK